MPRVRLLSNNSYILSEIVAAVTLDYNSIVKFSYFHYDYAYFDYVNFDYTWCLDITPPMS